MCEHIRLLLPKESDTTDLKTIGSENASTTEETTDLSTVVNSDNLTESSLEQPQIQHNNVNINNCVTAVSSDDSPKFDQYILDTITSVASSSSTSITSSSGYQNYCANGATNSQNTNNDPHEMPQLLNILNELLDGQDLTSLANSGGNGDNMHDIEDQEENYEVDSPRKDDPEEMAKILSKQRLEEISREEQQLRRRMDFLIRRLFKLVARSTGLHVSEEMAGFLEHIARYCKKKEIKEKSSTMTLSSLSSPSTKFPYLTANLQGTTDLLTSPTFSKEPPINLLSSPMTVVKTQDEKQSLPQQINNSNINTAATTHDVIEPTNELLLKPVPTKEMRSFLRRIENISTMQSTVLTKKALAFKYFSKTTPPTTSSSSNLNLTSIKSESNFCVSAIPKLEDADIDQVEQTSGLLMSEMRLIENQIDSDVTASSTGGESADEMTIYNNNFQQPLSISKRAAYKYSKDRGAVASRWCWLATQISELDYKIRQHTDLRKHIRENKGVITLESAVENQRISGASTSYNIDTDTEDIDGGSSARVRPLAKSLFRKRKLVQITNLHHISKKAARPSTLKCGCNWPLQPCALCTARIDPTAPRELTDVLPETERVALLDPCFHPVLCFQEDVSSSIHLEAIMNIPEWQSKMIRSSPKSIMKHATKQLEMLSGGNGGFKDDFKLFGLVKPNAFETNEKKMKKGNIDAITGKRKYTKRFLKMEGGPLASKLKERKKYKKRRASLGMAQNSHIPRKYTFKKRLRKVDGMSNSVHNQPPNGLNNNDKYSDPVNRSKNSSPVPINSRSEKTTSESRRTRNYDIDNIVIPYSVAAATRIELLSYKEIPTPKWRIVTTEEDEEQLIEEKEQCIEDGEIHSEDITDESITIIHEKALLDERKKFETYLKFPLTSRSRANRRIDSRGNESSGTNTPTPDQTSPPHGDIESIPPSPLDNSVFHDTPSITAILNNFNGRKERKRTVSKKDEVHDGGGYSSGVPSRCISPEIIKEIIPAYEPLHFPLSDVSFHRLKRMMPSEHLKHNDNSSSSIKYYKPVMKEEEASQHHNTQTLTTSIKHTKRPQKRRKHTDSISESILIREKLPSSSLATIGKNNNLLIPRNNHNILNNIDLKGTDGAALKKLMNNNNGDLLNGDSFNDDDQDMDDNSDSETITGDESLFEPDEVEETDSDEYLDDEMEMDEKITYNNKKKSSMISTLD
ncbi:hypothetical protein ACKWTF_013470 [Chironomus riparius]